MEQWLDDSLTLKRRPEVLVTLTSDIGKILTALHGVKVGGSTSFSTSIQIAQVRPFFQASGRAFDLFTTSEQTGVSHQ